MRVGDVSKDLGCSRDWLRELEKKGVIPTAPRDLNGHRRYSAPMVTEIRRIIFGEQPGATKEPRS